MPFDLANNGQMVLLITYIVGQAAVAVIAPLLGYRLNKPHLDKVARKVEEVAQATNGQAARLEEVARAAGYAQGSSDAQDSKL